MDVLSPIKRRIQLNSKHALIQCSMFIVFTLFGNSMLFAQGEQSLEEYRDQSAYRYFLETLALRESMMKNTAAMSPALVTHFTDSGEIAVGRLRLSKSKESYRGLANLLLIKTDGALSEILECAIMDKGKAIIPYLNEARLLAERGICVTAEAERLGVKLPTNMCRSKDDAIKEIDSFMEPIQKGQVCR